MFDLAALTSACTLHGPVARVVIADHEGHAPRGAGTSMLVWATGQDGTIGGGALEHQAVMTARSMLPKAAAQVNRIALGPNLGQCCGGAVTLVTEVFSQATLPNAQHGLVARSLTGSPMPLAVQRLMARARGQGQPSVPRLVQGWMVEPIAQPSRTLWIWGAGHVGRALVHSFAPLPDLSITWVDTAADRFPENLPQGIRALPVPDPASAIALAPTDAHHLIVTYSHALDLALCHGLLDRGFASCGLIGSATKWARFRSRLAALGHSATAISAITCPIGQPALGKHPQAIAIGVAAEFLAQSPAQAQEKTA